MPCWTKISHQNHYSFLWEPDWWCFMHYKSLMQYNYFLKLLFQLSWFSSHKAEECAVWYQRFDSARLWTPSWVMLLTPIRVYESVWPALVFLLYLYYRSTADHGAPSHWNRPVWTCVMLGTSAKSSRLAFQMCKYPSSTYKCLIQHVGISKWYS